jgi:hypothetical protein
VHLPSLVSLAIVVTILGLAVVASLIHDQRDRAARGTA